jgi:hypothetical protein
MEAGPRQPIEPSGNVGLYDCRGFGHDFLFLLFAVDQLETDGSALLERLSRPLCWLFLQRIYSHAHLLCAKAACRGPHLAEGYDNNLAI